MWNNRELLKALRNDEEVKAAVIDIVKEYFANHRKQQKIALDDGANANITENENVDRETETIKELKKIIQEIEKEKENLQEEVNNQKRQIFQNAELQLKKETEIEDYKKNLSNREKELEKTGTQLEKTRTELEKTTKELEKLQNKYQKIDEVYQLYLNLSSVMHSRLKRVLNPGDQPCESAEVFLAYGVQEGNIIALWDVINLQATNNHGTEELESLLKIFEYFFQLFKEVSFKKVEAYRPQIGTEFDERFHTRTSNSHVSGRIQRVVIPGFAIGQSITKKPLVYVE